RNRGELRVRARIGWHFGASAGRADCKAPRRRRCSDIVEERQRRRCPPAATPRRAAAPMHADYYSLMIMFLLRMGTAAKCQVILARALSTEFHKYTNVLRPSGAKGT